VQQCFPTLGVQGVDSILDEDAANAPLPYHLVNEFQSPGHLAEQAVGRKEQQYASALFFQDGPQSVQPDALVLVAPHGKIEEDVLSGNVNLSPKGVVEDVANLVSNTVLEASAVPCIDRSDGDGIISRKLSVSLSDDGVDILFGLLAKSLPFSFDFRPAARPFSPRAKAAFGIALPAVD
jgi:hypothetical protein